MKQTKSLLWNLSLIFFTLAFSWKGQAVVHGASDLRTSRYKILIDAGHGGSDKGATVGKLQESEITLKIATLLKRKIAADNRFEAHLTRETNKSISLPGRVDIAEVVNADLFLSIHANASPDLRARGVEFYFQNQMAPEEESLFLASHEFNAEKAASTVVAKSKDYPSDVNAIVEDLKRQDRHFQSYELSKILAKAWLRSGVHLSKPVRQAPFYVISKIDRPAVLIEVGFVTHPKEGPKLARQEHQQEIVDRIYQSVVEFYESKSDEPKTHLHIKE